MSPGCYVCMPGAAHPLNLCGPCAYLIRKLPKFGYEKPSPPKEMAEAA